METLLKFSKNNSKLHELAHYLGFRKSQVAAFDLPAGFTCPAAHLCRAYANRETGRITKGEHMQFLCYAAKLEAAFPNARKAHWHNFDLLKAAGMHDANAMASLILASMPNGVKVIRIHSSGDFFNTAYFQAWTLVAAAHPEIVFFGYTKVLGLLSMERPANFHLVYSFGGRHDEQAIAQSVPMSVVVENTEEAARLGLPVACPTATDPDDYNYIVRGESFALVLH